MTIGKGNRGHHDSFFIIFTNDTAKSNIIIRVNLRWWWYIRQVFTEKIFVTMIKNTFAIIFLFKQVPNRQFIYASHYQYVICSMFNHIVQTANSTDNKAINHGNYVVASREARHSGKMPEVQDKFANRKPLHMKTYHVSHFSGPPTTLHNTYRIPDNYNCFKLQINKSSSIKESLQLVVLP